MTSVHRRSALALVAALQAVGADARLLVIADDAAAPSDRARLANEAGAAASITVELAARDDEGDGVPSARTSAAARRTPLQDWFWRNLSWKSSKPSSASPGRLRPLTIAPLRETRMPAVQVEPLTGAGEREPKLLRDPALPSRVARAVAAGVGRYFSG